MSVPISAVPFFTGLTGPDLTEIMLQTRSRKYVEGQLVFREDDPPDGMYVVLSGGFRVFVLGRGASSSKKVLAALKPGAHVGEFGLIDGQQRSASVDCELDGEMLFLPAPSFVKVLASRPTVAKVVVENLCRTVSSQKGMIYKSEDLRKRIQAAQIPPTIDNMKALCKMLRLNNYTISRDREG